MAPVPASADATTRRCGGCASGGPRAADRAARCSRHEVSARPRPRRRLGGQRRELVVGHRPDSLGQLEAEQAAEAAASLVGRPGDAARTPRRVDQLRGRSRPSSSRKQVARVVVCHARGAVRAAPAGVAASARNSVSSTCARRRPARRRRRGRPTASNSSGQKTRIIVAHEPAGTTIASLVGAPRTRRASCGRRSPRRRRNRRSRPAARNTSGPGAVTSQPAARAPRRRRRRRRARTGRSGR